MRARIPFRLTGLMVLWTSAQISTWAQGTAFTYQGRLNDGANPANGRYDLNVSLFGVSTGGSPVVGPFTYIAIPVSNGLFTQAIDFGANFPGAARWLEIGVRTNGFGPMTTLSPRQPLTPTPYAIYASGAGAAGISGTIPAAALSNAWLLGGNSNTVSGEFIGTADDQPLDIRVNNARVMRYRLNIDGTGTYTNAPNVIGGSSVNTTVSTAVIGATIAGGGGNDVTGVSYPNKVTANYGTVSGGSDNLSSDDSATVGGGYANTSSGYAATICGGYNSTASGDFAVVPGGQYNIAAGAFSFAGGYAAHANHNGSFVWTGNDFFPFASSAANGFYVRCTGGARFVTAIDASGGATAGVRLAAGDTSWGTISDRDAKKNCAPVDGQAILEKLSTVSVQSWNYKWETDTSTPHLGPMAQDFKAAFYPGRDDKSITTLEFDGVELAAIQGLNQQLKEKEARLSQLENELLELKQAVKQLSQPSELLPK